MAIFLSDEAEFDLLHSTLSEEIVEFLQEYHIVERINITIPSPLYKIGDTMTLMNISGTKGKIVKREYNLDTNTWYHTLEFTNHVLSNHTYPEYRLKKVEQL